MTAPITEEERREREEELRSYDADVKWAHYQAPAPSYAVGPIRTAAYVEPARRVEPWRMDVLPPVDLGAVPPSAAQHAVELHATYQDRGKGFVLVVTPLAAVVGILAALACVALLEWPLLAWLTLLVFWLSFAGVWLVAFLLYTATGSDGIALLHTVKTWQHVGAERRFRHHLIERAYQDHIERTR